MYWKLLKNDISNNRLQSFNIAFFIILSVAFLAVAAQLAIRLNTSVSTLFKKAKTPHLLQMHTKEIDRERMEVFVESRPEKELVSNLFQTFPKLCSLCSVIFLQEKSCI